jgi:phosphonate transport system permease protein
MVHTIGALGKLFAEVIENIDLKPVEGLASTGASFVQICRFAVVPQVLSGFVSYTLFRFEVNVRAAGVIGLVGAGGIGQELIVAIRKFYYSDVSAILVIIIVAVMATDYLTSMLRNRFTSAGAHA